MFRTRMQAFRRWVPFLVILGILMITMAYMFLNRQTVYYTPQTDNPAVIYREACQHCHGDKGQGTGLLYPAFGDKLTPETITEIIRNGSFLMPAYVNITGDTLKTLSLYIYDRGYLNPYQTPDDTSE